VGKRIGEEIHDARVVILDCLTLLVSNVIGQCAGEVDPGRVDAGLAEEKLAAEIKELVECIDSTDASFIIMVAGIPMVLKAP
jgi:adenosyl cobinamide kinase/adenosyl cobinamide phosphate guanylyltransferase